MQKKYERLRSLQLEYLIEGLKKEGGNIKLVRSVFFAGLDDFLNKRIDVYEFESLSSLLLYEISDPNEIKLRGRDLALGLDIASDLTFYFKKDRKRHEQNLKELKKYFALSKGLYAGNKEK